MVYALLIFLALGTLVLYIRRVARLSNKGAPKVTAFDHPSTFEKPKIERVSPPAEPAPEDSPDRVSWPDFRERDL